MVKPVTKKSFLNTICICFTSVATQLLGQGLTPAVDLSNSSTPLYGSANIDALAGWEFTVNSPITLTALGLYSGNLGLAPAPTSGMVELWNTSGTLLASANVLATDDLMSGFKYQEIPSSLLAVGQKYIIAALIPAGSGFAINTSGANFAPELNYVAPRFTWFTYIPPLSNDFNAPVAVTGFYTASFEFATVPEPSTFVLAGLGLAALVIGLQRLKIESSSQSL